MQGTKQSQQAEQKKEGYPSYIKDPPILKSVLH